jgi:hypothetical protein
LEKEARGREEQTFEETAALHELHERILHSSQLISSCQLRCTLIEEQIRELEEKAAAPKPSKSALMKQQQLRIDSLLRSPGFAHETFPMELYDCTVELERLIDQRNEQLEALRTANKDARRRAKEYESLADRGGFQAKQKLESEQKAEIHAKQMQEKVRSANIRIERLRNTAQQLNSRLNHTELCLSDAQVSLPVKENEMRLRKLEEALVASDAELARASLRLRRSRRHLESVHLALSRFKQSSLGIPYERWMAERTQLMADIESTQLQVNANELQIENNKKKLKQLCDRIDTIAESVADLTRRSQNGQTIDESIVLEYRSSLLQRFPELSALTDPEMAAAGMQSDDPSALVPLRLYEVLEKEVLFIQRDLKYRISVEKDRDLHLKAIEERFEQLSKGQCLDDSHQLNQRLSQLSADYRVCFLSFFLSLSLPFFLLLTK